VCDENSCQLSREQNSVCGLQIWQSVQPPKQVQELDLDELGAGCMPPIDPLSWWFGQQTECLPYWRQALVLLYWMAVSTVYAEEHSYLEKKLWWTSTSALMAVVHCTFSLVFIHFCAHNLNSPSTTSTVSSSNGHNLNFFTAFGGGTCPLCPPLDPPLVQELWSSQGLPSEAIDRSLFLTLRREVGVKLTPDPINCLIFKIGFNLYRRDFATFNIYLLPSTWHT